MLKKILAGAITAVLSLGVVALVASPASAHHNTINPTVTCATDGSYKVDWAVTNSESNKTEVITASSNTAVVPVGTSFGFSETKHFIQYVSTPQNLELDLTGFWDGDTSTTRDDVYTSNSGWFGKDSFPTGCLTVTANATQQSSVCDGPNHYTDPTYTLVAVTGVKYTVDGTEKAAGTYPATNGSTVNIVASVTDPKYKLSGTSSWSFTFAAPTEACTVEVDPVTPDIAQSVCTGPGTHKLPTYTIPATTGVIYSVKINGTETVTPAGTYDIPDGVTQIEIIARGDTANYYTLTGGTKVWDFDINPADQCLVEKKPKAPAVTTGTCDVVNHPGVVPQQSYTLYYTEHVVYQVSVNGGGFSDVVLTGDQTFPVQPGDAIVVRAVADDATKYQVTFTQFSYTFTNPGDCKGELTPIEPAGTDQYCDETDVQNPVLVDGTITLTPVDHIQYFIDGVPQAAGVPITVTPGSHTVTAAPDDATKYKIKDGAVTSWPVDIASGFCLPTEGIVIPAVTSSQIGCFSNGSYTLSNDQNDPNAVIWTVNGSQVSQGKYTVSGTRTVTITAAPNAPAWGFDVGQQTSWTIDFKKPSVCDTETLAMTGQSPTGLLIAADMLVVAGLVMFAMRAVRRGRIEA